MSRAHRRWVVSGMVVAVAAALAIAGPPIGEVAGARQAAATPQAPPPASRDAQVDAIFRQWTPSTPGCAVGVAERGRTVLARAYGAADLEHDAPNRPETIFEAGSVSKQFTAAAVLRLVADGALALDDPVRKYIPELPDYGAPLTMRHLLSHTSGLRDWGSLAGISGWPRGTRVHTHDHVLDILSRQRALNFPTGTRWSYSNSGYNLSAIVVARVSGTSFADFSRRRVFEPLGLAHTSWRDDYARLVKGRALAYSGSAGGFELDMPFEQVHGNGGLLTTVGDLLRWNEHLASPPADWAAPFAEMARPATLADGRALHYGLGLFVGAYKGVPEVYHSGSTAGYRAFLTRFPDAGLSVAVLCNAAGANATAYAHAVSDLYLGDRARAGQPGTPTLREARGPLVDVRPEQGFRPADGVLAGYAGVYRSDEVETELIVERRDDQLIVRRRPAATIALRPHSPDRFQGGGLGLVTFLKENGRVVALSITQDRVWDLRFDRVGESGSRD